LDLEALGALLKSGNGRDRAFVDAMARMRWSRAKDDDERAQVRELSSALQEASMKAHAELRAEIACGALRGLALRARFDDVAPDDRNHFVEEVLGIAYPPLDEPVQPPELVGYTPSSYDEIVYAFDATGLGAGDRFLDIGSGAGKAVMLAALLAGATSFGVERDEVLHEVARNAARALGVDASGLRRGDAREAALPDADVIFMYLPFTGSALGGVMERLMASARTAGPHARGRFLCAGALDLGRYDALALASAPRSWLHVYAFR
jgi:SAM-dependent methyltransferase